MPATTALLASPSTGASAHTIPVFGFFPFADNTNIPPGIPPMPTGDEARAAEATLAPLPTKPRRPVEGSRVQARSDSFSPQVKIMGPFEPSQYKGEPCK